MFKKIIYAFFGIGVGIGVCNAIKRKMGDSYECSGDSDQLRRNAERAVDRLSADVDKLGR